MFDTCLTYAYRYNNEQIFVCNYNQHIMFVLVSQLIATVLSSIIQWKEASIMTIML